VCGAPNASVGMHVACALPGATLPDARVERVSLRGVESAGMLCSARELGIGDDHEGLLDIGEGSTVGSDVRAALELDDIAFTLKLTPNRGDCLSIQGIARELCALTGGSYQPPSASSVSPTTINQRAIRLEAGEACPRYCGRVITDVDPNARTPHWMVRRLQSSGVRPISAIVDITNYVMLEMGQPMHAFDHARVNGDIHVRMARPGERLKLLDEREIELQRNHLVIADDVAPIALAGVMGGAGSAVGADTRSVFLESAYFSPESVAQASRGLEIASDAAHRFERGVDFNLAPLAIERATRLLLDICGGQAGPVTESRGELPARDPVRFSTDRVRRMLGANISSAEMRAILQRLGFETRGDGDGMQAIPPSFRFDVALEVDIVEEVARVHGYANIPATLPLARTPIFGRSESRVSTNALKQALAARDYLEVITFSFVSRGLESDFAANTAPVALANPIASQMSVMRSSLIGSLIEAVHLNVTRKQERVRVFEVAACYRRAGEAFTQMNRLAGVCYGAAMPEQWGERSRSVDLFDVKGDLESLLGTANVSLVADSHPCFHPGQSARVLYKSHAAGWLGAIHPRLLQKYELSAAVVAFELDLDVIREREIPLYEPISRFPGVRRDIALVVGDTPAALIAEAIRAEGAPLVNDVTLFDIYRGKGVPEGKKSLAFRVLLQDTEKTLTDAEVDTVVQRIVKILEEKHGAALRT